MNPKVRTRWLLALLAIVVVMLSARKEPIASVWAQLSPSPQPFPTPIIYPTSMIPERFQWLMVLNPLTGLIEGFRYALAPSRIVDWNHLLISLAITLVVFVVGVAYFKRTEKAFADII